MKQSTRVQPETIVAWEGDRASGAVELAETGRRTQAAMRHGTCSHD